MFPVVFLAVLVVAVAVAAFITGAFVALRNPHWVADAAGKLQTAGKVIGADTIKVVSDIGSTASAASKHF